MGIISFLAKEIAKDIALDTTIGVAGTIGMKIESVMEKNNEHNKEKLFSERKKNHHLLICENTTKRNLLTNTVKMKTYTIQDEDKVKCIVNRYKKDKKDFIEICNVGNNEFFLKICEIRRTNAIMRKEYEVYADKQKYAEITVSMVNSSCEMRNKHGDNWLVSRKNEKEYEINHYSKVVGHFRNKNLKIMEDGMLVDFITSEETINILCLSLCFYVAIDEMV